MSCSILSGGCDGRSVIRIGPSFGVIQQAKLSNIVYAELSLLSPHTSGAEVVIKGSSDLCRVETDVEERKTRNILVITGLFQYVIS